MSTAWAARTVANVADNTGDLTQIYHPRCTAGSGLTTKGTEVRQATEGVLHRCEINPVGATGGRLELWDVKGADSGADSNTNTGTAITNAYLQTQIAQGRAHLVWAVDFKGDAGNSSKVYQTRTRINNGIAARYILSEGSSTIELDLTVEGCCRKVQICGQ